MVILAYQFACPQTYFGGEGGDPKGSRQSQESQEGHEGHIRQNRGEDGLIER